MKKILSIILSLLLVFSVIPMVMVSAEEGEETPVYAHVNIFDASSEDALSIASSKSSVTTSIEAYSTADGNRDVLKVKRTGKFDGCSVGFVGDWSALLSDAVGIRFWMAGDPETFATNAAVALGFVSSTKVNYKTATEHKGNWVPTAEGAVYEYYWTDTANSLWKFEKALDSGYGSAGKAKDLMTKEYLESITQIRFGVDAYSASEPYMPLFYIDDVELIKPFKVKIEGEVVGSGAGGQKITLPEAPDGVIAYTDGKNLYYPGEEFVIPGDVELTNITTIISADSDHDFVFDTEDKVYTGSAICPTVSSATLEEGIDYTVEYENNVNAGTGTIYIRGTGSCFIDISQDFTIARKTFAQSDFTVLADGLTYTGEALEPEVVSDIFTEDDYSVVYHNNVNAGDNAYVVVEATLGNGIGAVEIPFVIEPKTITDDMFEINTDNKVYTDSEIKTTITSDLVLNKDYEVAYANNVNVGTATVTITGKGNYTGTVTANYEIVPQPLGTHMFKVDVTDKVYTSKEICPVVSGFLANKDYAVAYENNVNVGVGTITITGCGNYGGTLTYNFNILQKEIEEADFDIDLSNKVYTGEAFDDVVTSKTLKDADYTVAYENNVDAGEATVTITGVGNCQGEIVKTFVIEKKTITAEDFQVDTEDKVYANKAFQPEVASELGLGEDYTVEYSNGVDVGTQTITITACGNNCEGKVEFTYEIVTRTITADDFALAEDTFTYSGEAFEPAVESALKDTDYTVEYAENVNAGQGQVIITGADNCEGEVVLNFTIVPKEIEKDWFSVEESAVYTGAEITPEVVSELVLDKDYTVKYENNVNVGTATVTLTGIGNYKAEVELTFEITPKAIVDADFQVETEKEYTGDELAAAVVSDLKLATDYTVKYDNNVNAGEATVTITGCGNYQGEVVKTFKITQKAIQDTDFIVDTANAIYTGAEITKDIMSVLKADVDYTVKHENNVNAGTATVIIEGIGNYTGTVTATFDIVTKYLEESNFTFNLSKQRIYSGKAYADAVLSELAKDVDYKVEYKNNVNAGTATVTVIGIGNYAGSIVKTFAIAKKSIDSKMFKIDTKAKVYTGKAITPKVTSSLAKGSYKVSYSKNKYVGTATITITGVGNYTGKITKTFTIKKPSVGKVKGLKVKSQKSKQLTVNWKKTSKADGYVIEYSLKKNFKGKKTITVKKQKTVKQIIKKLKSGKKYYVRIAAYKNYKNSKGKTVKSIGKYATVKKPVKVK